MTRMRPIRAFQRLGSSLLVVGALALVACGSGTDGGEKAEVEERATATGPPDQRTGATGAGDRPGGGGGAPIGAAPGGAVGSPIKIPALEQEGNPPSVIAAAVEPKVEAQCGGSLCVTLLYVDEQNRTLSTKEDDPTTSRCGWAPGRRDDEVPLRTELEVPRGTEVKFGFDCGEDTSDGGDGTDGTGGDDADEGEGSETNDTVAPANEDNGQPQSTS